MKVLIIDGQGGKIGRALTESIKKYDETIHVIAIGTNSMATAAMIKGGADEAATGENPVVVCASKVDVIMGPIGILVADALLGEVICEVGSVYKALCGGLQHIFFNDCHCGKHWGKN